MNGTLILARHHESEWNKEGRWTGHRDRHLTEYGFKKSEDMGRLIKDIPIHYAFASMQVRSIETLSSMLTVCELYDVPTEHAAALNERDYGEYTGKSKWDMLELIGEEHWDAIRRGWDTPIPRGETLKMVYERAVPYFIERIVPKIREGKNVLVVAHGNSCRALIKYIENLPDSAIAGVEMPFGGILIYTLNAEGHIITKEVRQTDSDVHA